MRLVFSLKNALWADELSLLGLLTLPASSFLSYSLPSAYHIPWRERGTVAAGSENTLCRGSLTNLHLPYFLTIPIKMDDKLIFFEKEQKKEENRFVLHHSQ